MKRTADPAGGQAGTMLEVALSYAARGWPVIPLWRPSNGGCSCRKGTECERPGKHPRTPRGFKNASTDAAKVSNWKWTTANVGIAPGRAAGLLVIDIDPRNGGRESILELQQQLGSLPAGPVVKTGGGGWHLYFQHPTGPIRKSSGVAGIDIKADGGFVVAPPSIHQSGGTYRWEPSPAEVALPELPAAWQTWLAQDVLPVPEETKSPHATESTETSEKTDDYPREQKQLLPSGRPSVFSGRFLLLSSLLLSARKLKTTSTATEPPTPRSTRPTRWRWPSWNPCPRPLASGTDRSLSWPAR